jgi:hypothetical protein
MPGNTHDGLRQCFRFRALAGDAVHVGGRAAEVGDHAGEAWHLVADLFDFAKDRLFERFWMMRPSCSVIEQKVQPPKQPRMMFTEKRIIS